MSVMTVDTIMDMIWFKLGLGLFQSGLVGDDSRQIKSQCVTCKDYNFKSSDRVTARDFFQACLKTQTSEFSTIVCPSFGLFIIRPVRSVFLCRDVEVVSDGGPITLKASSPWF